MVSDQAAAGIDAIANAEDQLGIDTLVGDITSGISSIGSTAEHIVEGGADSLFGTFDVIKYVPLVLIGVGGIVLFKYGGELISEGGRSYRSRR